MHATLLAAHQGAVGVATGRLTAALRCSAGGLPAPYNQRALTPTVFVCSLVVLVHGCVGRIPTNLVTGGALAECRHAPVSILAATHYQHDSLGAAAVPLSSRHGGVAVSVTRSSSTSCLHLLPPAAISGEPLLPLLGKWVTLLTTTLGAHPAVGLVCALHQGAGHLCPILALHSGGTLCLRAARLLLQADAQVSCSLHVAFTPREPLGGTGCTAGQRRGDNLTLCTDTDPGPPPVSF